MTVEFPPRQMAPELAQLLTFPCSLCNSLPLLPRYIHTWVSPPGNQPNTPLICVLSTFSCQHHSQRVSTERMPICSMNPLK